MNLHERHYEKQQLLLIAKAIRSPGEWFYQELFTKGETAVTNYIGLDLHSKTSTFVVFNDEGEITHQAKLPTQKAAMINFLDQIEGTKKLVFEETNVSQWAYRFLKDCVNELIVCNPTYLPKKPGAKSDYRDALHLAVQLRAGNLEAVYHSDSADFDLRAANKYHSDLVHRFVVLKKNLKALLRSEGMMIETRGRFWEDESVHKSIENPTKRMVAGRMVSEVIDCNKRVTELKLHLSKNPLQIPNVDLLQTIPGIGPIRAHVIASFLGDGKRFENKHKLWAYSMLVKYQDKSDGAIIRVRAARGRSELKEAFIGASLNVIIGKESALKNYYEELIEKKNFDKRTARRAIARKVASICLSVIKKGQPYNEEIVTMNLQK